MRRDFRSSFKVLRLTSGIKLLFQLHLCLWATHKHLLTRPLQNTWAISMGMALGHARELEAIHARQLVASSQKHDTVSPSRGVWAHRRVSQWPQTQEIWTQLVCGVKGSWCLRSSGCLPGGDGTSEAVSQNCNNQSMGREAAMALLPLLHQSTMALHFYGGPGFLHKHSQLWSSSLPPLQDVSSQPTSILSMNLLSKS